MGELIRLLYLVCVVLPLTLLLIGPLLVLAALRGVQRIGPIVFEPGRGGVGGRIFALLLGLTLWLVVWGGLALLGPAALPPAPAGQLAGVTAAAPSPVRTLRPTFTPSATPAPGLTAEPPMETAAPTPTPQPPASSTPTLVPASTEATPSPSPSPSSTPSPVPPTPTPVPPTATPTPVPTATPLPTSTPVATLSPGQAAQAIATVEKANDLLRAAVVETSIGNLAALEAAWHGEALAKAQAFAQDLSRRYLRPLAVTFVYLAPPAAREGISPDTAVVTSAETWTYAGPLTTRSESFEFTYTLTRQGEGWVITEYAYHNLPGGAVIPPPTPTPEAITSTTVITP